MTQFLIVVWAIVEGVVIVVLGVVLLAVVCVLRSRRPPEDDASGIGAGPEEAAPATILFRSARR